MDKEQRAPVLSPTGRLSFSGSSKTRPLLPHAWSSAPSLTSRTHRSKKSWTVLAGTVCLSFLAIWASIVAWRTGVRRRAQDAARARQHLLGFSESRVADIPLDLHDLSQYLRQDDLLVHPILTAHASPTCSLNMYQQDRYAPLLPSYDGPGQSNQSTLSHYLPRHRLKYLVAINLFDSSTVLPSLIRALHAILTSLDPSRFHVSIYENGSTDTTPAQLYLFAKLLDRVGAGYTIISDSERKAGWAPDERIIGLAALRNLALRPLFEAPEGTFDRVLFLNDVHMCEADLLEILLQHEVQEADMSCGMDYKELKIKEFKDSGYPLLFYDVWVARDMLGL
jgi:hypothetical protein